MQALRSLRFSAAALLALALSFGALSPAQARASRDDGPSPHDLYSRDQLSQSLAPCADLFPNKMPLDLRAFSQYEVVGLCSNNFAVIYSTRSKAPVVVVERLNRAKLADARDEERTDKFYPDPRLKAKDRASLDDFKGSGCDRGHMAPAADQPDAASMAQSFALTNMVCQDPTNNRKIWSKLESDTRKYAMRASGDVYVFSGPLFLAASTPTVGRGKVWVPSDLFKLVYDASSKRAWVHVLPNNPTARIGAPMSYADFVKQTGLRLLDGVGMR